MTIEYEETKVIHEDLDLTDISSVLNTWAQTHEIKKQLINLQDTLEKTILKHLKKRKWNKYKDPQTKISVEIIRTKEDKIDKHQLKDILTPSQLAQIQTTITKEQLTIITPKTRKRLKRLC